MITWLSLVENDGYEGTLKWHQPENTLLVSPPVSFDESVQQSATYWVSQTTGTAGCESQKSEVVVNINEAATMPVVNSYNACATVSGGTITWESLVNRSDSDKLNWFTADNEDPESTDDSTTDPGSFDPTTPASIKTYYVQIEDINGCKSKRAAVSVTIKARPVAVLSGDAEICKGQSANLTVSFTGTAPFNFTYSSGASVTTSDNPYTINVSPASTTTYSLTSLSDANNCTSDAADLSGTPTITVNDRPSITGVFTVNPLCNGAELLQPTEPSPINNNGSPVTTREWQIGQGATFAPLTFPYEVSDADNGKKILFIATNSCSSDTVGVTLTVNPLPTATLNNPSAFCQGTLDSEPDKTIAGYDIIWYTASDGATPTAAPTVQNLPATGSPYDYFYKVQNRATLCQSSIHTYTVTINPLLTPPSITKSPDVSVLTCTTTGITLTAAGGSSYLWDNGQINVSITVNSEGTYEVTVTDDNGCTAKTNVTITENKTAPTVSITNNTNTTNELTCNTQQISLTANGGDTYVWDDESGSSDPTIEVTTAGIYTVTATNATNGCYETKSIEITANTNLPTVVITTNPAITELTCETTSIDLTATSGFNNYSWVKPNGMEVGANATLTVTDQDMYTVIVTDGNGCTNFARIAITQNIDLPAITVSSPSICEGNDAIITASGADDYTWTPAPGLNATDGASVTVYPETTTTYTVEGTVRETGCKNTATATVYVETPPVLTLASTPESVELGNEVTITVTADRPGHGVYEWFINNEFYTTTNENNITLEPSAGRQYFRVETRTTNLNCFASSGLYVNVNEMIPNIINPYNPDSKNCCFMVSNEGRQGYHVEIYNRYQQKVFEGYNGWDGTYRGAPADPGTYFFRIFMKNGKIFKGAVEVVKF
jgi:gliding motility-associated-like protein